MGKIVAAVVVVVLAFLGYTWLFDTDVESGSMPEIEVEGGEAPDVDVRGPEVTTGETEITVPTIDVDGADDDLDDGEDNEIIEGEGSTIPGEDEVETDEEDEPYNR